MTEYERDPEATTSERGQTTSCSQPERDSDRASINPSSLNEPHHISGSSPTLIQPKPESVSVEPSPRPPARRSVVRAAIRRVSWSGARSERAKAGDLASAQRMRGAVDADAAASTQCTRDEIKPVASPTVPLKSRASWFGCLAWGDDHPVPAHAPIRITVAVPLAGTDTVAVAGGPGTDMGPNNLLASSPADLAATPPLTPDLVLTPPLDDLLPTPTSAPGPLLASQLPLNTKATPSHKRTSLPPFSRRISRTFRKTHARANSLPPATTSSPDTPQLQAGRARGDTAGGRRRTRASFRESWRQSLQLGGMGIVASTSTPRDRSWAGWRRSYTASPADSSSIPTSAASSTLAPSPSTPGSSRRAWSWSPVTRMPSLRSSPSSTHNPATSPTHTAALSAHLLSDTFANRHSHAQPRRHRRALSLLTGLSLSRSSAGTSGSSGLVSSRSTSTIASFGHDGDPGGGHDDFDDGDGEQPHRSLSN